MLKLSYNAQKGLNMRKLQEKDKNDFIRFVDFNPTLNLFYKGDYLAYGFDSPECEFFSIDREEQLEVCIMIYRDSMHVSGNYITDEESKVIYSLFGDRNLKIFNTSQNFFNLVENFPYTVKVEFCQLAVYQDEIKKDHVLNIEEIISDEDLLELVQIRRDVFNDDTPVEIILEDHRNRESMSYGIRVSGKIVSIATATAHTDEACMVVGVATQEAYRNKGYAKSCMSYLCNEMKKKGKKTVLFYSDPIAGKVYHSIGFTDQEPYIMMKRLNTI